MANQRFDDTAGTVERALSYFKDNNVKVVALDRDNLLRKCYSLYDMRLRREAGQDIFNREGGDDAGAEARLKAKLDVPFSYWAWCLDRRAHFKAVFDRIVAAVPKGTAHVVKYSSLCFNPKQELDGIQQFLNLTTPLGAHSQLQKAHSGSLHSMVRDWEATRTRLMKETHWGSKIKEWEAAECG
mmetsp:Transcript_45382/g.73009  ORF Transcript_45382/g.73009 Transcript_45382/m.73009 type:complete len:184 (+) Transcript_45382:562-1113(+)